MSSPYWRPKIGKRFIVIEIVKSPEIIPGQEDTQYLRDTNLTSCGNSDIKIIRKATAQDKRKILIQSSMIKYNLI